MAVTGSFYNTLEFGNINSGDYGVYITGTGVYNAPARAVEMVSVPGRNGDVPIDMGHWDNIEVTYKCGLFGIDQSEMGEALMEFRNAIASQIGYQRLSDSYNPNEFRLGLFMAGLEFDAVSRNRAGEFELKFNCKPQRFLTDGEEMIDIRTDWSDLKTASGEVVTFEVADDAAANYTQFKSLVADIEPVQSGSGTPSPDNICPISGWDSVEAVKAGKNLLDSADYVWLTNCTYSDGTVTATVDDTRAFTGILQLMNGNTVVRNATKVSDTEFEFTKDTTFTAIRFGHNGAVQNVKVSYDASGLIDGQSYVFTCNIISATNKISWNQMMLRLASETDSSFVPYQGTTHTATFDETVYGGTVDLVSGELVVDRAYVDLGTLTWAYYSSFKLFAAELPEGVHAQNTGLHGVCSQYRCVEGYNPSGGINDITQDYVFSVGSSFISQNNNLLIRDTRYTDSTAFKTAMNGVQLVYELAEPRTIQLDPQTISTLVGANNVWANSGDVTLEYGVRPGVLINPTQYESQPLLEIEGTGEVSLNDYVIAIDGGSVGEVELASERRVEPIMGSSYPSTITETIDMATTMSMLEDGDTFNISTLTASWLMGNTTSETYTITQQPTDGVASIETATSPRVSAVARFSQLEFAKGEANTFTEEFIVSGQSSHGTGSVTFSVDVDYDGSHTLTISYGVAIHPTITGVLRSGSYSDIGAIIGNSSKQTFSGQVIIDSETGDAYRIEDGTYISLNKYIQLGAELPSLRPGANVITYDDTITSLKIAPRWWRL